MSVRVAVVGAPSRWGRLAVIATRAVRVRRSVRLPGLMERNRILVMPARSAVPVLPATSVAAHLATIR